MGGNLYPWSQLMAGWRVLSSMDSQMLRRHILSSRAITLTSSISMGCSWSPTAVRGDFCFRWSLILVSRVWAVSLTYCAGHSGHWISYMAPHFLRSGVLSLGWTRMEGRVLKGLWSAPTPWFLKILASFLDVPLIYGRPTLVRAWPLVVL